jgi:hypothetical protein
MSGLTFIITDTKYDTAKTDDILSKIGEVLPHGSGINSDWNIMMASNTRVRCQSSFHCMDENGMYDGHADFVFLFDLRDALHGGDYTRLMFIGRESQYKAKKYDLRDYLWDLLCETLYYAFGGEDIRKAF